MDDETEALEEPLPEERVVAPETPAHPAWLAMRAVAFVNALVFVTLVLAKLFVPKALALVETQTLLCIAAGANTLGWYVAEAFVRWASRSE